MAQVDLAVPLAVPIQHCDRLPYAVPFPPYGPHTVGVGFAAFIFEVVVDPAPSELSGGSNAAVEELAPVGDGVVFCVRVEVGVDFVFSGPLEPPEVVDELLVDDNAVVILDEVVEAVLVGPAMLEVDVTAWHVDDTISSANFWKAREQEF